MSWVLIIFIVIIVILILSKTTKNSSSTDTLIVSQQVEITNIPDNQKELDVILGKMVDLCVDGLTSMEMNHNEKISITNESLLFFRKNLDESRQRVYFEKIVNKAYEKILKELLYDAELKGAILKEKDLVTFDISIGKTNNIWNKIMYWTDNYHSYLEKQREELQRKIQLELQERVEAGVSTDCPFHIKPNIIEFEITGIENKTSSELSLLRSLKAFETNIKLTLSDEKDIGLDIYPIEIRTEDNFKIGYVNYEAVPYFYPIFNKINMCEISLISKHEIPIVWAIVGYSD